MSRTIRIGSAVIVALTLATPAPAQTSTWNGITTDWNTAGNWNPLAVPRATTIPVTFTDNSAATVNVSSIADMAQSLTFNNPTTNYTLTSSPGVYLTLSNAITMNAGPSSVDQINLAGISTGSLLYTSGSITIANNTINGGSLAIGPN